MSRRPGRPSVNFPCSDEINYSFVIERHEIENFYVAQRFDDAADEDAAMNRKYTAEKRKTTGPQYLKMIEECPNGFRATYTAPSWDIYPEPPNENISTDQPEPINDDAMIIDDGDGGDM